MLKKFALLMLACTPAFAQVQSNAPVASQSYVNNALTSRAPVLNPDFQGNVSVPVFTSITGTVDMTLAGIYNPEAVKIGHQNRISFCPMLSCIRGPFRGPNAGQIRPEFFDHQRASLLVSGKTQLDNQAQENLVAIIGTSDTGDSKTWAPSTYYNVGDNVVSVHPPEEAGSIYRATNAGRSGTTQPPHLRPETMPYTFSDGEVVWQWINDSALGAKASLYVEQDVRRGSGSSWGQATNVYLRSGLIPRFHVNTEFDFGNDSGIDCGFGNGNCYNLFIRSGGSNMLTSQVSIESVPTGPWSAYFGLRVTGPKTAKYADIVTDSSGAVGIGICSSGTDTCNHSSAGIQDASTSPIAYQIKQVGGGTMHSVASIVDDTTTPTFASIAGIKTLAGIYEHSTSPAGVSLAGSYSRAQIEGRNWKVDPQGTITAFSAIFNGNITETTSASPASNTPCTTGQRTWDASWEYRCISTNRWRRTALSDY